MWKSRKSTLIGRNALSKGFSILFLLVFAAFIIVPFLWMITASLRQPIRAFDWPPRLIPTDEVSLRSYQVVFEKVDFGMFIWNSIKVAVLTTAIYVISAGMAAYAFARLRFPGSRVLFMVFLSAMMIPGQVTSIPRFIMMSRLHLINSHVALYLPAIFGVFGIFLIRQFMMTIPPSFDEAAYIDGANRFYCFLRIIVPMSKPALMVIGIQTFIASWNDFYNPLIYINSISRMTLPLGLTALRGMLDAVNQSAIIASVMIMMIAPLLFYIFGQRYLIEGINLGGLKA